MNEFDLIKNYFATQTEFRSDVIVGIGDDAAIVKVPNGHELAISTDTLIADVHFPAATSAYDVGYKALAVNLSDLTAMGATPAWVMLAITLPTADEAWIQSFCDGFFTLANRYQVQLIGGDLTHGPLTITVQALGFVAEQQALMRSGAKPGDLIYVTGTLGDAGLGLQYVQKKIDLKPTYQRFLLERLNRPEPRVEIGKQLVALATAAIDLSDGLVADLDHILKKSGVGAIVYVDQLPLSEELKNTLVGEKALEVALTAGDDYELCFTIPAEKRSELEKKLSTIPCLFTCIGEITQEPGFNLRYQNGTSYHGSIQGYKHF